MTDHESVGEQDLEIMLAAYLTGDSEDLADHVAEVNSFADAGVMTLNKGLVVRLRDGNEFQLTIVQSQQARR